MLDCRSLYFALPLPLTAESMNARLAGMGVLQMYEGMPLETALYRKLLLCKHAPHAPLSPIYLFQQNIDPFNLKNGDNALKFLEKIFEDFTPKREDDILVCFSARHIQVFDAMCVQNFFYPYLTQRFKYVLDLRTALETCYYFGNTKCKNSRNLNKAAKELGFSGNLDNQIARLDAMWYIYDHLMKHDPKIMSFLLRPVATRFDSVNKSPYFVHIDEKGKLSLLKLLAINYQLNVVKAIKASISEVSLDYINMGLQQLMAPTAILTKERQEELSFNVDEIIAKIEGANLYELIQDADGKVDENELNPTFIKESKIPLVNKFFMDLSPEEHETFRRYSAHDVRLRPSQEEMYRQESKLNKLILCYMNENFPAAVMEGQRQQYAEYINETLHSRMSNMAQEIHTIEGSLKEDDEKGADLLSRIITYLS